MRPLYIFDLDGTLALIEHRRHILDEVDKDHWRRFYAACDRDEPNDPVIIVMEHLRRAGAEIWIFSGRSIEVYGKTVAWLVKYTSFTPVVDVLQMRGKDDHRPDDELKEKWLNSMLVDDRERLVAVFDDRDRIVQMWRRHDITCFQVANGDY